MMSQKLSGHMVNICRPEIQIQWFWFYVIFCFCDLESS